MGEFTVYRVYVGEYAEDQRDIGYYRTLARAMAATFDWFNKQGFTVTESHQGANNDCWWFNAVNSRNYPESIMVSTVTVED